MGTQTSSCSARPFLRWAGGKQWLARRLTVLLPREVSTYYEPFLGGGSLFFALQPRQACLGDLNPQLIDAYLAVRDDPQRLSSLLRQWENEKETYYRVRNTDYSDRLWQAAQFIYLNKTCWNGLHRVNRQGKFNVPFGYNGRKVFDRTQLLAASEALQRAALLCCDFEELLMAARAGDVAYLDPPYTVSHAHNGFRQYNERLFSWEDQKRLARVSSALVEQGCHVVVSNADNQGVIDLYPGFACHRVSRHSVLAADAQHRTKTEELVLLSPALAALQACRNGIGLELSAIPQTHPLVV